MGQRGVGVDFFPQLRLATRLLEHDHKSLDAVMAEFGMAWPRRCSTVGASRAII
jgi:hypothetical protein